MSNIGKFECINDSKLQRAIHGSGSKPSGGVGEDATEDAILAAYDRLGGAILYNGRVVKMGSFYDFEKKAPRTTAEVKLIFKDLNGRKTELPLGAEIPMEIQAAEKIAKEVKEEKRNSMEEKKDKMKEAAEKRKIKRNAE